MPRSGLIVAFMVLAASAFLVTGRARATSVADNLLTLAELPPDWRGGLLATPDLRGQPTAGAVVQSVAAACNIDVVQLDDLIMAPVAVEQATAAFVAPDGSATLIDSERLLALGAAVAWYDALAALLGGCGAAPATEQPSVATLLDLGSPSASGVGVRVTLATGTESTVFAWWRGDAARVLLYQAQVGNALDVAALGQRTAPRMGELAAGTVSVPPTGTARTTATATPSPTATATLVRCASFRNQAAAQAAYRRDPIGLRNLDGDSNGVACESLPCPCDRVKVRLAGTTPTPEPTPFDQPREVPRRR